MFNHMNDETKILQDVDAVILAGGVGSRLRPSIGESQKVMAQVGPDPFLVKLIRQLKQYGARRIVLCTGYKSDQVREFFGDHFEGVKIIYSIEQSPLGTGGALRKALDLIRSDEFLVMNGDSFAQADLESFVLDARERRSEASILLANVPDTQRFGKVECDESDRIVRFEEKTQSNGPGFVNAGVYLLKKGIVAELPSGTNTSLERELFPRLIGRNFVGYRKADVKFIDIGLPESLEQARKEIEEVR